MLTKAGYICIRIASSILLTCEDLARQSQYRGGSKSKDFLLLGCKIPIKGMLVVFTCEKRKKKIRKAKRGQEEYIKCNFPGQSIHNACIYTASNTPQKIYLRSDIALDIDNISQLLILAKTLLVNLLSSRILCHIHISNIWFATTAAASFSIVFSKC